MAYAGQAYSLLDRLRRGTRLEESGTRTDLTFSMAEERQKEMKKQEERASKGFVGRMIGGGGLGLLAGLLTGPLGLIASSAITGLAGGIGSYAGQKAMTKRISPGKWNVTEDERREKDYKTGMYGSAFQDAMTSGMLSYLGGKFLTSKPGVTPAVKPTYGGDQFIRDIWKKQLPWQQPFNMLGGQ